MDRAETITLSEGELKDAVLHYLQSVKGVRIHPEPSVSFSRHTHTTGMGLSEIDSHTYSATLHHASPPLKK